MKIKQSVLLGLLCLFLNIAALSQDPRDYNYNILSKEKIIALLDNTDFDHLIFNLVTVSEKRLSLKGLAYTKDNMPIGKPFILLSLVPNRRKRLNNLLEGIYKFTRGEMEKFERKKLYFVPTRYKDQEPGPNYVSYKIMDVLDKQALVEIRMDPSPPARID